MSAPTPIFIDPRVAARLPVTEDEAGEQMLGDTEPLEYVSMEYHASRLLEITKTKEADLEEWIVQISGTDAILYGLSNLGRTYAYGDVNGEPGWHRVAEAELR